jgi:arylsulfatase A-like enzyme
MPDRPNVVFLLADQLRAASLPLYGETQIGTPNIDRLAADGVTLTQCISTCPVCTPYRAMLMTGRHPQTTGMVVNSTRTRYGELGLGDVFACRGYRTGYLGKWHLHTGAWPANNVPDWVPRGRARLGFDYWRGYNQHMVYFNGTVHSPDRDFDVIRWKGYETEGLFDFAEAFLDADDQRPFFLFVSPQQPHAGMGKPDSVTRMAPDRFYEALPEELSFAENVPEERRGGDPTDPMSPVGAQRNYLAMILALDEMLGKLLDKLEAMGELDNTIFVFTSDHGTQGGAHADRWWNKKHPYEESLRVPCVVRLPGRERAGTTSDALTAPVDFIPTLCGLCDLPVPRSVEGYDLSAAWKGAADGMGQDAVFCMNFGSRTDYYEDGNEWRAVRTREWQYTEWLDGRVELYDLVNDGLQQTNLADDGAHRETRQALAERLRQFQRARGDEMLPGSAYAAWVDEQRRVIRNGYGELGHPEDTPDWSLLI